MKNWKLKKTLATEIKTCEHESNMDWLMDIEYKEQENTKTVALTFICSDCDSEYTKYWQCSKEKK